ncbi:PPOX class F420-dependent oxidoreductase [Actinocrispum wychmicini]|uniref:Pyridoxamine 5'-phosphate oxidase N-terminal domain-containing protein n=1 Tax=Actinocrispum wychmicini TaxID=1213861 RepID=A0A4V2S6M7_9PSEU|nr:PPOX class F420-dependent oxidoreductase [Actinocrispum wychmicini]TCO56610.1 hypothetical protein EV192_10683 [Actinocrispum wychmicini]
MDTELARLADGKYVLVTTFRRDGTPVGTPVWVCRDGESLVFSSGRSTGKVKRLRRDNSVELAACDIRGMSTGAVVKAKAELLDATDAGRIHRLLARKYGFIARLTFWGSRLRRGREGTVCFAVTSTLG